MSDPKKESEVPEAIKQAAQKMKAKSPPKSGGGKGERNQLITRPGASNRQIGREAGAASNLPARGGALLAPVPDEVKRSRERTTQLRRCLADGVASTDSFLSLAGRLISELENFKGGKEAADLEGLDVDAVKKAVSEISKALDKHFPQAKD